VRIQKRGQELALQAHDELGYVVPDEHVDAVRAIVEEELRVRPAWCPTWPLDAESAVGKSYGECK
jgi:DNA polymerase I-like protein with 3'-5' exonuclease and polymerase domains